MCEQIRKDNSQMISNHYNLMIIKEITEITTSSPEGQCFVLGPGLFMNLLTNRVFANVPRDMMWKFPLRDP